MDADGAGPAAATTEFTVYDGQHAWADFDAAGTVKARYLFGNRIDEILARWRPGAGTAWYLTDRLGSARDLVDAAGMLRNHIEYSSFGAILAQTAAAYGDRFLFTGREWDADLGLYYYRARFYDPGLGRFISQDPWGLNAGDVNLYRYGRNNPLLYVDPMGTTAFLERHLVRGLTAVGTAAVGFLCGYISGITRGLIEFNGDFAKAHELAWQRAKVGLVIGGAIGLVAAYDPNLALVLGTTLAIGAVLPAAVRGELSWYDGLEFVVSLPCGYAAGKRVQAGIKRITAKPATPVQEDAPVRTPRVIRLNPDSTANNPTGQIPGGGTSGPSGPSTSGFGPGGTGPNQYPPSPPPNWPGWRWTINSDGSWIGEPIPGYRGPPFGPNNPLHGYPLPGD